MNKNFSRLLSQSILFFLLVFSSPRAAWSAQSQSDTWSSNDNPQDIVQVYEINQKPLVSLTFDDASQTIYDAGFPILESYGIPATFYFLTANLNNTWKSQLVDLQDHGWEIGSHTRNHYDLTTLNPADLVAELSQSKMDLESAGLSVTGFAYPYGGGSRDGNVLRYVKQYYTYARSTSVGYNKPIINQYALKTQVYFNSDPIDFYKSCVDEAIANHEWLTINLHAVDRSGDLYSITPENLTELASYIHSKVEAGNFYAVTMREGVNRYSHSYWFPINDPDYLVQDNLVVRNGKILWFFNSDVSDYLSDGYEWIKSGNTYYWEMHGEYRAADNLALVDILSIDSQEAVVEYVLEDQLNGNFRVTSHVSIKQAKPFADVSITQIEGPELEIAIAKNLTRRFSLVDNSLVTDGLLETGMRSFGINAFGVTAFDTRSNLLRIIKFPRPKIFSEYSNYSDAEFRGKFIHENADLPFLWCVGGVPFETLSLLSEAERGITNDNTIPYSGTDASPGVDSTGVELKEQGTLDLQFKPPYPGNYTLAIRLKSKTSTAQFEYFIDGDESFDHMISSENFTYVNIPLQNLSDQIHTFTLRESTGHLVVDYILLIPKSRSSASPVSVLFPADVSCGESIFLPWVSNTLQP